MAEACCPGLILFAFSMALLETGCVALAPITLFLMCSFWCLQTSGTSLVYQEG